MTSMADLLANQEQTALAIEQLYSNFKKDGAERKTPDYIKRRLKNLDAYWQEYQSNHITLCGLGDQSHAYFTSKQYDITKERFSNVRSAIQNYDIPKEPFLRPATPLGIGQGQQYQNTPPQPSGQQIENVSRQPSTSNISHQGTSSRTDELLRKQGSNFKAFEHTITNISLDTISEKWEFDHLLRVINTRWSAIDSLHWELDSELAGRDQGYDAAFYKYERTYNNAIKSINQKMWSMSHRDQSIPKIEIPTFHGSYHQWTSFKDLFTETIHNNLSLSGAQKMQFLKSKVKGEAEKLIQHLSISSDNYSVCWEILTHRFDNKKLILNSLFDIMLSIPAAQQPSFNHIKRLHDSITESLNAIRNLDIDVDSWDPLLVYLMCQKLDADTHKEYVTSLNNPRDIPTLKDFLSFLENKFTTIESSRRKQETHVDRSVNRSGHHYQSFSESNKYHKINKFNTKQPFQPGVRPISQSVPSKNVYFTKFFKCPICQTDDHGVFHCQQFIEMSPSLKRITAAKYKLCQNCLYCHHGKACISDKRCRECNKAHNTLLHLAFEKCDNSAANSNGGRGVLKPEPPLAARSNSHVSLQCDVPEILLATALVNVRKADGTFIKIRALLDQGSQTSLITENAAQLLGLSRQKCHGVISGVGIKESNCKGTIHLECSAINSDFHFETAALIMKNLIKNLPSFSFNKPSWSYLDNITLADPEFNLSRPVDLLLGADVYSMILLEGICRSDYKNSPIAQNTRLGWILSGNVKTLQCNVVLTELEEIHKFWEIEDITTQDSTLSTEDQQCVQYYKDTTTRREDGRYEVRLPFKPDFQEKLGNSKSKAIAQFRTLERKFSKNQLMEKEYKAFMNEYQALGHMTLASNNSTPDCHLTHHAVERPEASSSKFRVVFNASMKTSSGCSLNDVMMSGPNLQQDLQSLILKWRQYQYAFTADLEKMFRFIWMNIEDQKYQKIIWRNCINEPIKEYQLTTVSYGTRAAPFLAMMTLKQLASDEKSNFSSSSPASLSAPDVLEQSFYMDDLVHGAHDIPSALLLCEDLIKLLKAGGFNLRKWRSNIPQLNDVTMSKDQQEQFNFKGSEQAKTLGLSWNPEQDTLSFDNKISLSVHDTKRSLLSNISKLFDPLGLLAPLSTKLKILFQNVWLSNINWDDQLPDEIRTEWNKIKEDMKNIDKIKINRWIKTMENDCVELHGYCDASTKAYAAVIYCKINKGDKSDVTLFVAKTRLVPCNSSVSLPRLELCGAVLLSNLMSKAKQCLSGNDIKVYGWCDSMACLGWINGDPARWKTFVSTRVKKITDVMPPECWRYVKSEQNPADCASRGLYPTQLIDHPSWWSGPSWLPGYRSDEEQSSYMTDLERKCTKQVNIVTEQNVDDDIIHRLLSEHSSFTKIIRILAWILRTISKNANKQKYLSLSEIKKSKQMIIKYVQNKELNQEINKLKINKLSTKSNLSELNPFLDNDGILRVGGRLRNAQIDPERKHPIIIPSKCRLADLIIDQTHELIFHGGARLTSAFIRQKYWIIGGNRAVKSRLSKCVRCRRHNPMKHDQLMGDLPSARVTPSRPFYHTGVDLTGFVDVKTNKGRGVKTTKGYIVVFVCMVTKAIHLELVSDLTSSSFLAALRRMAARRGAPRHVYSDNGTNFVRSSRVLHQEYVDLQATLDEHFYSAISDMEIHWHFNAPSNPSAGGLWESAVKSLKYHLKRVVGEQKLTYEEYATLLAQIEACLNARPLCALTESCDDLDYLTPSHFLASGPTLTIIETERDQRTRWQLTQKIFDDVWQRWSNEYLTQLLTRCKWRQPKENLKVGDVVIIHDANLPSGKWGLGRIVTLHPGGDGYVRVVTLKTKNGLMKRPVTKISLLPVQHEKEESGPTTNSTSATKKCTSAATVSKSIKSKSFLYSIVLWLIMTIISPAHGTYQISCLNNSHSIYFDKIANMRLEQDQWKLVIYYDMSPYWQGTELLGKYINYLDGSCSTADKKNIPQCDVILLQLHHGFAELEHYNGILLGQQFTRSGARVRRGYIDGVGSIANQLFGLLDANFAVKYERDILTLRENEKHLALLWKNQTSVVEAEFNLIKRLENSFNKQHKSFNQHLNYIQKEINEQRSEILSAVKSNDFTLSSVIANSVLLNLKRIQETLVDAITNVYQGRFNFHILTPDQLRSELNLITGLLSKDLTLPVNNIQSDLSRVYQLLTVKARALKNYIIFEVNIPLVSRDDYEIYKLFPVPRKINNNSINIIPVSDYVAVNIQKDSYVRMSDTDIHSCVEYDLDTSMCTLNQPVFHMGPDDENLCSRNHLSGKCETKTTTCVNSWAQLRNMNTYLFFCCGQCTVRVICGDHVTAEQLCMAGIMTISGDCVIKGTTFTIYPHKQRSNTLNKRDDIVKIIIPPINNVINITIPVSAISDQMLSENETTNYQNDLEAISKQIEEMKASASEGVLSDRISYHDVHHYVAIYLVLIGGGVVLLFIIARRLRERARLAFPAPAPRAGVHATPTPVQCVSDSVANQCSSIQCSAATQCELSDLNHINLSSGCVHDRATSPIRQSEFSAL